MGANLADWFSSRVCLLAMRGDLIGTNREIRCEAGPRDSEGFQFLLRERGAKGGPCGRSVLPVIGVTSAVHPRGGGTCRLLINYLPGGRGDFRRCPILHGGGYENCTSNCTPGGPRPVVHPMRNINGPLWRFSSSPPLLARLRSLSDRRAYVNIHKHAIGRRKVRSLKRP